MTINRVLFPVYLFLAVAVLLVPLNRIALTYRTLEYRQVQRG